MHACPVRYYFGGQVAEPGLPAERLTLWAKKGHRAWDRHESAPMD